MFAAGWKHGYRISSGLGFAGLADGSCVLPGSGARNHVDPGVRSENPRRAGRGCDARDGGSIIASSCAARGRAPHSTSRQSHRDNLVRSMPKPKSDIGLIGLAVMGQNLALNIADHGFQISVYNRTTETMEKFVAENPDTPGGLVGEPRPSRNSSQSLEHAAQDRHPGQGRQGHRRRDRQPGAAARSTATSSSTAATRSGPTPSAARSDLAAKGSASSAPAFPAAKKARASARR